MQDELRESHFEAVVIGTGLTQSIVAAALAAANKHIIHIDESETYGGPHASLALAELSSLNPTFHPSLVSRQFSLSLTPHLIPATGPFIAALVNSGVSRYGSFVLPKRVVVRTQEGFKNVPANKQDVFRDKAIGLVQKRRLIKFLMFASGEFEGSSELDGKETTPLLEFVQEVFGIDKELSEALSYAVAFCVNAKDQTLPALLRTRTYLRSVGRYGPSPFLIGHYGGAGELAQGFCRTCAWLASVLDTPSPSGETKSDAPTEPKLTNTIRAILITDSPTTFASPSDQPAPESDQPAEETKLDESIIIFPSEEGAVSVLVNGASTMSCPDGKCILYFAAQSTQDPKEYFAKYISAVLDACSPKPEVWGEVYWREREVDKIVVRHADQSLQPPPREEEKHPYSTTHLTEGSDAAAREAERVFWDSLGEQPGEDGKGKDGVEFFARVQREEDLFDD
ncbi:Rab proteins geranylgeranyltransferase component A [Ceratobasidium sp. 423]|nr:Rab proteins geranylgeranyltransferase component A [Ceratobasidium sp. 423]